MTDEEKLRLLEQKAAELAAAAARLRRYEEAVERAQGEIDYEIYAELRCEVWAASSELDEAQEAADLGSPPELTAEELAEIRRRAQEEAIANVARARGWQWEEADRRWRTPDGRLFSPVGEPL